MFQNIRKLPIYRSNKSFNKVRFEGKKTMSFNNNLRNVWPNDDFIICSFLGIEASVRRLGKSYQVEV